MKGRQVHSYEASSSKRRRLVRRLYIEDQDQRRRLESWNMIQISDRRRADLARAMLSFRRNSPLDAREAFQISVLLHHDGDYRNAFRAAEMAIQLGHPDGFWIAAAIYDRVSLIRHGGQLYGTHFEVDAKTGARTAKPSLGPEYPRQARIEFGARSVC